MARKKYDDDDGRVIAPMNVDGMPWYQEHKPDLPEAPETGRPKEKMTGEERRAFLGGAMKAALLVTAIFFAVYFLVILIMYLVF